MAWKEYYIYTFENTALNSGSGQIFTDTIVRTDTDAPFELIKRSHVALDNRILCKFSDDAFGRNYQNDSLEVSEISGAPISNIASGDTVQRKGLLPFILPSPIEIKAGTNYNASFSDFSGQANSIRMSFHGAKLRTGQAPWDIQWRARVPFDYTHPQLSLSANATGTINIACNIDSNFIIKKITAIRSGAALVTVKDGATDRQWMDRAVHIDNFAGNAHFPNILPAPRFVYKGSVINITVQDISGAANNIRFCFSGEKLF